MVGTALERAGIVAVLTGGSAATFYTTEYQSLDLDFVLTFREPHADVAATIASLGYVRRGSQFEHPATRFTLDFPRGPLMIGGDEVVDWETARRGDEAFHVLTRTDCVRDRLAAFYHWNDRSSLRSACAVAASGDIEIDRIAAWSERESAREKFAEFRRVLIRRP